MAMVRKRGMPTIKELFIKNDPTVKDGKEHKESNAQMLGTNFLSIQNGGDRFPGDLSSSKSGEKGLDLSFLRMSNLLTFL
jgi:hypothetical protein